MFGFRELSAVIYLAICVALKICNSSDTNCCESSDVKCGQEPQI